MPAKQILFGADVRAKIMKGIGTLAEAVRVTLGPKARTEDALHATRAAVGEGVLAGGVGLLRARACLTNLRGANPDQDAGIRIVLRALEDPLRQLVTNSGQEPSVVLARVMAAQGDFGFNASTGEYGDLAQMGVLDPCKVTRTGLQNAASIAGLALTTDVMIARIPEPRQDGSQAQHEY